MKRTFVKISFLALLIAGISCNNNRDQSASGSQDSKEVAEEQNEDKFESKEMRKDADFVADQVAANYAEVELAKLGAERSSNSDVKRIAQKLVTEHQKNIKELGKLATQKAISVPSQAEDKDLKTVTDLRDEKDAKDFNNQWCKELIDKHESAIKDYENQLENTEDPELKTWISNTLPGLRTHLDELKACHDKMKNS
jgi:putative membrane protein